MAKPVSGYVYVAGVGYVPKFDINAVYNNTKSTTSSTQVITTTGEKKKVSFDKIFSYLEKAVGLFGTVADGISKIKSGAFPQIETDPSLDLEDDWIGANPDGVKVDEKNNPNNNNNGNGGNSFAFNLTSTDILLGVGGYLLAKKSKLI